jgi:hypothetical protein
MLMVVVVVQLNCTRPCTPLLLIRTPPAVSCLSVAFPPGPDVNSSMLVSRYGSPFMVTVSFLQSRNSIRDEKRKAPVGCGKGLTVVTIDPPPVQGSVTVFGAPPARLPPRAAWLIACVIADRTADSAARLDGPGDGVGVGDGVEGEPPHPATRLSPASAAQRFLQPMGYSTFGK